MLASINVRRALWSAGVVAAALVASFASADEPPFDFSDAFYLENGVNPEAIVGRINGMDGVSVFDETNDPTRRGVRSLLTIPAFDHSGGIIWFNVFGELVTESFTDDAAGVEAREIADDAPIYIFPRAGGVPTEIFPKRQEDLVDLRHGYFSNNPLGLWVFVFVHYTDAALHTREGQAALEDLAERNGRDLDGTPIIRTLSEIDSLVDDGFVELVERNRDGSEGSPWSICPVIEDPRDGAIAPDAFLANVTLEDGSPLPAHLDMYLEFNCLQSTGDFCDGGLAVTRPFPGVADADNSLIAANADEGERVWFVYGFRSGAKAVPGCSNLTVDIANPVVAGSAVADAFGQARLTRFVGAAAAGQSVRVQSVSVEDCEVSEPVDFIFP
ncbi:MAG: hypothetical protein ACF8PN_08715 [Phycisphaerales bacterium]